MRILIVSIVLLFGIQVCVSQNIPSERKTNWNLAGNSEFVEGNITVNVLDYNVDNTGTTDCSQIIQNIINSSTENRIIYFPTGTYLFTSSLQLQSNVIIRGNGAGNTVFKINLGGTNDFISVQGNATTTVHNVTQNGIYNDSSIFVDSTEGLEEGSYIRINDDDLSKITSTWALKSTGQIVKINQIVGNQLLLASPLRRDFMMSDSPYITKLNLIKNVGIEKIKLERLDATTNQTSTIIIQYALNAKINCIESYNSNFSHISINNATNIVVEGSYFKDAFDYGNGGKGYGVVLQTNTGECLIYNNIFNHLRHSILLQAGSNGNVISYNYSKNPFWTGVFLPSNSAGDLVLHGNYPYLNLFEGNITQNIVIDDSHGKNGPFNTFFRNRAELYGIVMNNNPATDNLNLVSNEITNTGFLLGNYALYGSNHFEYGNNVVGTITPAGTTANTLNSYYRNTAPNYYLTNSQWPPIGTISSYNVYTNQAKSNDGNSQLTICSINETLDTGFSNDLYNTKTIIHPNPFENSLRIKSDENFDHVTIVDISGKQVFSKKFESDVTSTEIQVETLKKGVYIVIVSHKSVIVHKSKMLKK